MIDIRLNDAHVRPGHSISGSATWHTDQSPDRVSARVGWITEGRGDRDEEYFSEASLDVGESEFGTPSDFDFTLPIPADAPSSYDGKILRVIWVVEVRLYLSWAKDVKNTARFRVDA
ncbi:MAG: hypothetical protein OEM40_08110 [Acidimicrobiia bacterium]|nr:hypothetical protein [Acidimicrobiia bacterium]MDH5505000.1 hypothetical protein [Acidimicrobiia bacterium]